MVVTTSSVYNLQSKRGLPLANQILGWVALGELPSSPSYFGINHSLRPRTRIGVVKPFRLDPGSVRLTFPVRISNQTSKSALEDPLVLPRVLCLFCDPFHQRRGTIFPFVFGPAGRLG